MLALLRAVEALKPVLARVVLARTELLGALRAGEGSNGWGAEEYSRKEPVRWLTPLQVALRNSLKFALLRSETFARVGADLLGRCARCAPRCR